MRLLSKKKLFAQLRPRKHRNLVYYWIETECCNAATRCCERLEDKLRVLDTYLNKFKNSDNVYSWLKRQRDNIFLHAVMQDMFAFQSDNFTVKDWDSIREVAFSSKRLHRVEGHVDSMLELCQYLEKNELTISKKGK